MLRWKVDCRAVQRGLQYHTSYCWYTTRDADKDQFASGCMNAKASFLKYLQRCRNMSRRPFNHIQNMTFDRVQKAWLVQASSQSAGVCAVYYMHPWSNGQIDAKVFDRPCYSCIQCCRAALEMLFAVRKIHYFFKMVVSYDLWMLLTVHSDFVVKTWVSSLYHSSLYLISDLFLFSSLLKCASLNQLWSF